MISIRVTKPDISLGLASIGLFLAIFVLLGNKASAASALKTIDCSKSYYDMFYVEPTKPVQGEIYVKLANKIPNAKVNLYFPFSNDDGATTQCESIGSAEASSQEWTKAGLVSKSDASLSSQMVADGPTKSADAYQATIKLLVLPDKGLCESVDSECRTTYQGKKGTLRPILQSGATDQIAIYSVLPISNASIKEVSYFSDGTFLYTDAKKQINPVNRNYLADGQHTVVTQVTFDNGQKFNITENINMGKDYTGFTTLKSYYYKSHNRYLYVIGGIIAFLIFTSTIMVARALHQRRLYRQEHGIDKIKDVPIKKEDDSDKIVVG